MKLRDNPFYVLNKGCGASREAINAAAEELSFFDEDGSFEKAQTALLSPTTRLSAEMDWFPGLTKDQVSTIRNSVEKDVPIAEENLEADILSWINIKAYNFQFIRLKDEEKLQQSIEMLDSLFYHANAAEIIPIFRTTRQKAKMPQVFEDEITKEINRKRAEIRQIIAEKLRPMDDNRYICLITNLSEMLILNDNNGGIIIDAVDQYELRMNDTIQEKTADIRKLITKLKSLTDIAEINRQVHSLIERVKSWDQYVQPIQLKCQASGMTHEVSKDLGRELQQLSVFLHNERDATEAAAELAGAMRGVFAELVELAADFHKAEELLSNLAEKNREAKEIVSEIEAFEKDAKMFPINSSNQSVAEQATGIGDRAAALSKKIKAMKGADDEDKKKLRTAVYMIARDVAIRAHNEHEESAAAYTLMDSLKKTFGDMPEWRSKLEEETDTLKRQAEMKPYSREAKEIMNEIEAFKKDAETFPHVLSKSGTTYNNTSGAMRYNSTTGTGSSVTGVSRSNISYYGTSRRRSSGTNIVGSIFWIVLLAVIAFNLIGNGIRNLDQRIKTNRYDKATQGMTTYEKIDYLLSKNEKSKSETTTNNSWQEYYKDTLTSYHVIGKYNDQSENEFSFPSLFNLYTRCGNKACGKILIIGQMTDFPYEAKTQAILLSKMGGIPKSLYPKSLDEVEYIVEIVYGYIKTGEYTSGSAAIVETANVRVLQMPMRNTIYESSYRGKSPPYQVNYKSDWISGGAPAMGDALYEALLSIKPEDSVTPAENTSTSNTPTPKSTSVQTEMQSAQNAAKEVDKAISSLGSISLESEKAIRSARSKYDALSEEAKMYVSKLGVLTDAEQTLQKLLDKQAMSKIKDLYGNGDYEGTIAYAEDYYSGRDLQTVPDEFFDYVVWSYVQRSRQYENAKQYEKALALMEKCVSLYSKTAYGSIAQEALDHLNSKK